MVAAVSSFAVMAGVMNLAGYVAVGHHHPQGSVFTIISIHIVGMYGLVLFVGDAIERIGRRRSMVIGLAVIALSNAGMAWFGSIAGMSLAMFGLGLGWCLSYIAATTELVDLAGPVRARAARRALRPALELRRGGPRPGGRCGLHRRRRLSAAGLARDRACRPGLRLGGREPGRPGRPRLAD